MLYHEILSTILGLSGVVLTMVLCGWLKRKLRRILAQWHSASAIIS